MKFRGLLPFIGSALLGALAMDFPQTLWPLIFVFLTPVIRYAYASTSREGTFVGLGSRMFVFGFIFAFLSTPWMLSTYPLTWLNIDDKLLSAVIVALIWIGFSTVLALPMIPWIYALRRTERYAPYIRISVAASVWILLEYGRSWFVALGAYGTSVLFGPHHTYYSLAYVLSGVPVVRDLFAIGGLYLVTFLIVCINFVLLGLYESIRHRAYPRTPYAIVGSVVILFTILSSLAMSSIRSRDGRGATFTMSIVNTHMPSSTSFEIADTKAHRALDLVEPIENPDGVLIFPENLDVLNLYLLAADPKSNPLSKFKLVIASHPDDKARSMYFFEPATKEGVRYQKQLLMPIGEYSIAWIEGLVRATGNATWIGLYDHVIQHSSKKGAGIALYHYAPVEGAVFAGSICAENISPYIFRDETRAGATVLTNISALSPFRNSRTLARQTRAIDTARALENGRYLVVAGNDLVSFVISDTGETVRMSDPRVEESYFNAPITVHTYVTPYVAYGDYVVMIAAGTLIIAALWLFI